MTDMSQKEPKICYNDLRSFVCKMYVDDKRGRENLHFISISETCKCFESGCRLSKLLDFKEFFYCQNVCKTVKIMLY